MEREREEERKKGRKKREKRRGEERQERDRDRGRDKQSQRDGPGTYRYRTGHAGLAQSAACPPACKQYAVNIPRNTPYPIPQQPGDPIINQNNAL
jgi:hypothetical protein